MLTPATPGRQGHVINAAAEWSARHEVELQEAMRARYIAQSAATVAGPKKFATTAAGPAT